MNPPDNPEIKNVTPLPPESAPPAVVPPSAPGLDMTALRQRNLTATAMHQGRMRMFAAVVALLLVSIVAYKLLHHHRSQYEATADSVTAAIVADNMGPVVHKFSDRLQTQLLNHEHVGELADSVAPLGKFEGSTETTKPESPAGFHEFDEKFANGTWDEKYELDADGKITRFHIGPKPTAAP